MTTTSTKRKRADSKPAARPVPAATRRRSVISPTQVETPQRRRQILTAASELFATHGYHGVSLRDIAERANVPIALCSYYFGRKHELFMALYEQNASYAERRIAALNALATDSSKNRTLENTVRAWIEPVLQMISNPESSVFATLVTRSLLDPAEEAQAAIEKFYDPVATHFLRAIQKVLPDRDFADLVWGYSWAIGALQMYSMDRRIERISKNRAVSRDFSRAETLINFICAGFRSLPTKNTRQKA